MEFLRFLTSLEIRKSYDSEQSYSVAKQPPHGLSFSFTGHTSTEAPAKRARIVSWIYMWGF